MIVGLIHLHRALGYLLVALLVLALGLTVAGGRSKPGMARAVQLTAVVGTHVVGGIVILVGLGLTFAGGYSLSEVWPWTGLLLWPFVAVAAAKLVKPEVAVVRDGGEASTRMIRGVAVELALVTTIVLLMTSKPF